MAMCEDWHGCMVDERSPRRDGSSADNQEGVPAAGRVLPVFGASGPVNGTNEG